MVLTKLRRETHPFHEKIEKVPLLKSLTGTLSEDTYIAILKKFYGFYLPLEKSLIPSFLKEHPDFSFFFHPKLHLLEEDLKHFDMRSDDVPICLRLPELTHPHGWLGVFYTMEGSCLGRSFLWPKIQKSLQLVDNLGGSFFSTGSKDLKANWQEFCNKMCTQTTSPIQEKALIEGSIQTFLTLESWFLL